MAYSVKITAYDPETDVATVEITKGSKTRTVKQQGLPVGDKKQLKAYFARYLAAYEAGVKSAKTPETGVVGAAISVTPDASAS